MTTAAVVDGGSFRDPGGHVFESQGRIFRTVTERAAADYEFVRETGFLSRAAEKGWLVGAREVDPALLGAAAEGARYVLEHPRLPFVSYPYEWSFQALKAAALLHLDLHLAALEADITLADATAYNVQFQGARPVFIDLLALRRYQEGEYWLGHQQFCQQFLNPLLLRSLLGVPHNAWYRGSLEGIEASELAQLLRLRHKVSWRILAHVVLPARLQSRASARGQGLESAQRRSLPRGALRAMLIQLRTWIARLAPRQRGRSVWSNYVDTQTYSGQEQEAKRAFIEEFVGQVKPGILWDLGCNTGDYSAAALAAGAGYVVGFDLDQQAIDAAFERARADRLEFLPLVLDSANPSPDQGWNLAERKGLHLRAKADAVLALALEHHLAIARNVPLDHVVAWLTNLAPRGVIEFVQKTDETVQKMLQLRADIFDDYDESTFETALGRHARIVKSATVSESGRRLYWFDRT